MRSAGKAAAGAVPLLVASLPQRFEASRQPCFLYVASELIKTFGDEPARDLELGEKLGVCVGWGCVVKLVKNWPECFPAAAVARGAG